MSTARKVPTVHLPLRPDQIRQLMLVLADWLEEADETDLVEGGLTSQHSVDVTRALHAQLAKLDRSLLSH